MISLSDDSAFSTIAALSLTSQSSGANKKSVKRKVPEFEDDHNYGVNGGDEGRVSLVSLLDANCALRASPICTSSRACVQKLRNSVSVRVGTLVRQHDNVSPLHTHSYSPHNPSSDYVNHDTGRGCSPGPSVGVGVGVGRGVGGTGGGTPHYAAISPIQAGEGRGCDYDGVYAGGNLMSGSARHFSPIPTHHQLKHQHQLPHQHLHTRDPPPPPWPVDAAGEEGELRRRRCIEARTTITPNADAGGWVEVRLSSGRRVRLPTDGCSEVSGACITSRSSVIELASILTPKARLLLS